MQTNLDLSFIEITFFVDTFLSVNANQDIMGSVSTQPFEQMSLLTKMG